MKCLVTKLNVSINNASLKKLGVLTMDIAAKEGAYSLEITAPLNKCKYKVYSKLDNQLIVQGMCDPMNTINLNSPIDSVMEIDNKYDITSIVVNQNKYAWFQFSDLAYISNLKSLILYPYPSIKNPITQNIAELAPLTKLILLHVEGHTYITGTIEEYVIRSIQKGRRENLTTMLINTDVRFNRKDIFTALGNKIQNIYLDFTTTPGSCIVKQSTIDGKILGTYNGQSWQYS